MFALQDGGQCFTSNTASGTFDRYKESKLCSNGLGGPMANDVYLIITKSDWNFKNQKEIKH